MQSKRKAIAAGVTLLLSLSLLFASTPVVKSWGGDLKPLSIAYFWSSADTVATGWFANTSASGIGVVGYGQNNAQGVQGANHNTTGFGVVGFAPNFTGVRGVGGSGSGDMGGWFTGYIGGRATSNYYRGLWASAYATSGNGVHGYSDGTSGHGVYGYNPNYIGVAGYGDEYGTYGNANGPSGQGVRGYSSGSSGKGVYGYASGSRGYGGYYVSNLYRGLYADGASSYYDAYFPNIIYAGGSTLGSFGMALNALNDGSEALEPGDLVAFSGFVTSAEGSEPTLAVKKVSGANSQAIVGVVQSAYVKEKIPAEAMQMDQPQIPEAPVDIEEAPIPEILVAEGDGFLCLYRWSCNRRDPK